MNIKKILIIIPIILLLLPVVYSQEDVLIDSISAMNKPEDVSSPMGRWEKFLNWIELIGIHLGFWSLVILFFLLFTIVWWLPLKIYPIIRKHRQLLGKFIHLRFKA